MPRPNPTLAFTLFALAPLAAGAQVRVIGSVPISEAATTGALAVSGNRNLLGGSSMIAALDRPAHISLFRGGEILVCQSSVAHLTGGQHSERLLNNADPLLVSLDRGAIELHMPITRDDALITPDFRVISVEMRDKPAQMNLTMRVTPNGDTCVENGGKHAPTLAVTDAFGETTYLLKPRQHVLFEHGSLKEVVDTETSSCGCPAPISMSLAEAAVRGGGKRDKKHTDTLPFPAAVSEGLTPALPLPGEKAGATHVQVAGTLTYDPGAKPDAPATPDSTAAPTDPTPPTPEPPTPVAAAPPPPALPPDAPPKKGPLHSVGHFFKKIFAR